MSRCLGAKGYRDRRKTVFYLPDHGIIRVCLRGRTAGALRGGEMTYWLLLAALAWPVGALFWNVYDYRISPLLIPATNIEAEALTLVERFGDRAAEIALAKAQHDYQRCDLCGAGRWERVARRCAAR